MRKIIYSVLACVAAVGCSQKTMEVDTPSYEIQISTGVQASEVSKAAIVEATTDLTGIQFLQVNDAATTLPGTKFTGATVFSGNRAKGALMPIVFTDATPPRYTLDNKYAFLKGYYPAGTVSAGVVTWTIDGKTDILISDGTYEAGKYSETKAQTMIFKHALAQLEVICVADADAAETATQFAWGTITSIELVGTAVSYTYTYATDAVASTGIKTAPLVKPGYIADFTAGVALTKANSTATAAGMFAPVTGTGVVNLLIKTSEVPAGVSVPVQLKDEGADKGFEAGKKHTVTLNFKADAKNIEVFATTIDEWNEGYKGTADVVKPVV